MSDHEGRGHHRDHATHRQGEAQGGGWWTRPHKDWRVWVVVGLMLLAMLAYVMSMDEAIQPGGQVEPPTPAAP